MIIWDGPILWKIKYVVNIKSRAGGRNEWELNDWSQNNADGEKLRWDSWSADDDQFILFLAILTSLVLKYSVIEPEWARWRD